MHLSNRMLYNRSPVLERSHHRGTAGLLAAVFIAVLVASIAGCDAGEYPPDDGNPAWLHEVMKATTDVMVHDIFSPPQASRVYAYASTAAYEALAPDYREFRSVAGQLNGLTGVPQPHPEEDYYLPLSSIYAFLLVAEELVYSQRRLDPVRKRVDDTVARLRLLSSVRTRSIAHGENVAAHVLAWAREDHYNQTRGYSSYTVKEEPGRWIPTPPGYMDAIEPNWHHLRPFAMDSSGQFRPKPPVPFDVTEGSPFYEQVMEVYEETRVVSETQREIAAFWDCNPYVLHIHGHAKFATKQMTPGAHWMGIAANAARQDSLDLMHTAESYMLTSLALADAFISNWEEKFRSNLIRPETVINKHFDEGWIPLLQTPPFPEYTSGHSVISRAAAEVLTAIHGDSFAYRDTVVVEYGLEPRHFESFRHASDEAAISRMYGGIHYRMAIDEGIRQGYEVGHHLLNRVQTRDDAIAAPIHARRVKPHAIGVLADTEAQSLY